MAAAAAAAAAEAAEAASFFQLREGEAPLSYAMRVFERVYGHDIQKVLSMEVIRGCRGACERWLGCVCGGDPAF